jgi:hypothetical protein
MLELAPTNGSRFIDGQNSFINILVIHMKLIDATTFMLNAIHVKSIRRFPIVAQLDQIRH